MRGYFLNAFSRDTGFSFTQMQMEWLMSLALPSFFPNSILEVQPGQKVASQITVGSYYIFQRSLEYFLENKYIVLLPSLYTQDTESRYKFYTWLKFSPAFIQFNRK